MIAAKAKTANYLRLRRQKIPATHATRNPRRRTSVRKTVHAVHGTKDKR